LQRGGNRKESKGREALVATYARERRGGLFRGGPTSKKLRGFPKKKKMPQKQGSHQTAYTGFKTCGKKSGSEGEQGTQRKSRPFREEQKGPVKGLISTGKKAPQEDPKKKVQRKLPSNRHRKPFQPKQSNRKKKDQTGTGIGKATPAQCDGRVKTILTTGGPQRFFFKQKGRGQCRGR